jgi:P27 family predicted phage terminase small subunit
MSPIAKNVWNELAPDLEDKGCLTSWDVYHLETFCEAVATWRDCRRLLGKNYIAQGGAGGVIKSPYHQIMRDCVDIMAKIGSRFGLSPGDRANMTIEQGRTGPAQGAERILG